MRFFAPLGGFAPTTISAALGPQLVTPTEGAPKTVTSFRPMVFINAVRAENCPASLMVASDRNAPFTRICAFRNAGSGTGLMTPETVTPESRTSSFAVGDVIATPGGVLSFTVRVAVLVTAAPFAPTAVIVHVVFASGSVLRGTGPTV